MADDDGANELPDPHSMSKKKLIAEVIENRAVIAQDREHYRKARDFLGEKIRGYHIANQQQEEALHFIEGQLREANKLLGRDPEHGIDFRDKNGEKKSGPIPVFSETKISPPTFDPSKCGFKF